MRGVIKKPRIGVVGGSLAGLTAARRLLARGYDVTVFERSAPHAFQDRGAGIALPPVLVQKCIDLNLFSKDIPQGPVYTSRTFNVKDHTAPNQTRKIWTQPLTLSSFNWAHLYSNLRDGFPDERYLTYQTCINAYQTDNHCYLEVRDKHGTSRSYEFDRIIAADGVQSIVRNNFFPKITPEYADYIAWRGIIDDQTIVKKLISDTASMHMFENGHFLFYPIPASDFATSNKMVINWLMYEYPKNKSLKEILTDKNGKTHEASLPPGSLTDRHIFDFHYLTKKVLPDSVADWVCQTKQPFIQAIFDFLAPTFVKGRICVLGDAGAAKRPHLASGATTAISAGIDLAEEMNPELNPEEDIALKCWNTTQLKLATQQVALGKIMGKGLVTEPPNWHEIKPEEVPIWWNSLMKGEVWHATAPTDEAKKKIFTPGFNGAKKDLSVDRLCEDFNTLNVDRIVTALPKAK